MPASTRPAAARRVFAAALALASLSGAAAAQPVPGFAHLSGLSVDVRPFLAQGGGAQAEALRADLDAALRRSLGGRVVGGAGPRLVLRVRGLSLTAYAGGQGSRLLGGAGQSDYLDGEALLVARDGAVLARHPQLSALPASSGGAWYDPDSERRRIAAIAEHYAQWLDRTLPAR